MGNWYCYHRAYLNDYFLLKEYDKKTDTMYIEMYFSVIPPFKEHDRCYISVYNHHNVLEANVFVYQHHRHSEQDQIHTGNLKTTWNIRHQGIGEHQKALYAVSKTILKKDWYKSSEGRLFIMYSRENEKGFT